MCEQFIQASGIQLVKPCVKQKLLSYWDRILPILAIIAYFANVFSTGVFGQVLVTLLLVGAIMSAVHHSELILEKIGDHSSGVHHLNRSFADHFLDASRG